MVTFPMRQVGRLSKARIIEVLIKDVESTYSINATGGCLSVAHAVQA